MIQHQPEHKLQREMDCFSDVCNNSSLTSSIKKTALMNQSAPRKPNQELHITVKGQNPQGVDNFSNIDSTLSLLQ